MMEVAIRILLIVAFLYLTGSALGIPERMAEWGKRHAPHLTRRAATGGYNKKDDQRSRRARPGKEHHDRNDPRASPFQRT